MGGCSRLADGGAFANEFQGDGTPHGQGFVSFNNVYQPNHLESISDMLASNIHGLTSEDMVQRVTSFMEDLCCGDHFGDDKH
eukprot:7425758-Karenia_brevis.AAC.1